MAPAVRITILSSGVASPVLDATLTKKLHYTIMPGSAAIVALPAGSKISLEFTGFSANQSSVKLMWTAENFKGLHKYASQNPAYALQQTISTNEIDLQFTHRCFVSGNGYASWRLQLKEGGPDQVFYTLTSEVYFKGANDLPSTQCIPTPDGNLVFRKRSIHGGFVADDKDVCFFESLNVESVVAEFRQDRGKLYYHATNFKALASELQVGSGLSLYPGSDNLTTELWQPCDYNITTTGERRIDVEIGGITTTSILKSWRENVARRYYDGLALNHAFTMLPELSPDPGSQPLWNTALSVIDNTALNPGIDSGSKEPDWIWYRQDGIEEYPTPYLPHGTTTPAKFLLTKVKSVRIATDAGQTNPSAAVSADLRAFRRQDGGPVHLGQLTLTSPQQDPNGGDRTVWKLHLVGSAQLNPQSPAIVDPVTKSAVEQVVRAGGFALHFLPPQSPSVAEGSFQIDITADFGWTSPLASPEPVMPVISCNMTPLPLWDCAPAAEDDLNGDEYAQLYVGAPDTHPVTANTPNPVRWLNEIYSNMQRDRSIVFRRPSQSPKRVADGQWSIQYEEQSSLTEKQYVSMQLLFTPTSSSDQSPLPDDSVLVFSRNPYSFADVHFHPLTSAQADGRTKVADWNSVNNEWRIAQLTSSPSYMVLPPQVVGEENVTSDTSAPSGIGDDTTVMAVGMPTVITYAADPTTNAVKLPWDLHRLTTDASLRVSRVDYEMLYGMVASTNDPADHLRLTEAASLYGDLLGEFPPLDLSTKDPSLLERRKRYLLARLHWSRIHREYRSRLGVFVLEDSTAADPESFTDTTHTVAQLRLDTTTTPAPQDTPRDQYLGPSLVPQNPPPSPPPAGTFKGGALNGVDQPEIYKSIVTVNNGVTKLGNAAVINPRFSALGGFGTTRGSFNHGISTLINTISMGRTVTYTVEQVGRIACHWNRAKHVVVYERTVVPSRQFFSTQMKVAYRGIPLVRKVEEYVEFLEPDRVFAEESAAPETAFARGFKCGERKRISVDSAWGQVVPNQGWKVPLWNPSASQKAPDVYPKPQLYLEVTSPEQTLDSTNDRPSFLTSEALLTHPEEVFFYTSFVETNADTDTWKPVETVDFVCYPLIGPDVGVYDSGNLSAVPLPEFPTPPGWEAVTFRFVPPAVGVHVSAGIVSAPTPLAAQLTRITVSRGPRPKPTTVRGLLANDQTALSNYTESAAPLAAIPQAFQSMRAAITAELAAPNTKRTQDALTSQIAQLQSAGATLQTKITAQATDMASRFVQPYKDAANALGAQITANAAAVNLLLKNLNADLANPPAAGETVRVAVVKHLQQTFQATSSEVRQWQETDAKKLAAMLDLIVRQWSDEIERALASYAVQLKQPLGTLSPLRRVTIAYHNFHDQVTQLHRDVTNLLSQMPTPAATLAQAQAFARAIAAKAQTWKTQFDASLSELTRGLTNLQRDLSNFDPSLVLLAFHTAGLVGQFETLVDAAFQAVSLESVAAQSSVADALKALMQALAPVSFAVTSLNNTLGTIDSNLSQVDKVLDETVFDLLRGQPKVQQLYTLNLAQLRTSVETICATPAVLLGPLLSSCSSSPQPHCGFLDNLAQQTTTALNNLAALVGGWIGQQVPGLLSPLAPAYTALQTLADQIAKDITNGVASDFAAAQTQLDSLAGKMRGSLQQAGQYVDQYVRQPLMAKYQSVALEATSAMRVLRAFGAPPQVPNLDIQPPVVGFLYDGLAARIPITPILARANQAGQVLNALGVHLPTIGLAEGLIPAKLSNFNLTDVLPNFAGLRLPGLFSGIKLPDIDRRNIAVTHGWEPQTRRAWMQADVNVSFTERMVVFNAGFVSFVLTNANFIAQSRVQNSGTSIQQSTSGKITGTWNVEISDSNALISFASTTLAFDENGKFQFLFKPQNLTLSDALKAITALVQTFSDPDSGFTYGVTPTGVKCAFALPVPDTAALTSGFTGLKFSTSLALDFASDFKITLAIGVSSRDRPFNFAIFVLGGCGYLTAGIVYNISQGHFEPIALEMAIGCSASLAIALGPISGGVYAQFAIELRNNGGGFTAGAFFQITGHVSICGVLSVDMVFRLEASYGAGVMIATGHFSITVKLFMFSFSVSRDVSMQMGSGGQHSTRLAAPPIRASTPQILVAALRGPDGAVSGLADAFAAADPPPGTSPAARYLKLLL
jgi:hypothetical protein